jgi:hypothetical protein
LVNTLRTWGTNLEPDVNLLGTWREHSGNTLGTWGKYKKFLPSRSKPKRQESKAPWVNAWAFPLAAWNFCSQKSSSPFLGGLIHLGKNTLTTNHCHNGCQNPGRCGQMVDAVTWSNDSATPHCSWNFPNRSPCGWKDGLSILTTDGLCLIPQAHWLVWILFTLTPLHYSQ